MEHGSEEMYRKELRSGEEACEPCKAAHAEHMTEYRRTHPRDRSAETRVMTIKRRALNRLALEYPERFSELVLAEEAATRS